MNTGDTAWLLISAALVMFMTPGPADPLPERSTPTLTLAILISAVGTLLLGLFPSRFLDIALHSVAALLG